MFTLTKRDISHLRAEFRRAHREARKDGDEWASGYEDVMTSRGYVALWSNGEVTMHGRTYAPGIGLCEDDV